MSLNGWLLLGLLSWSVVVTAVTSWMVLGFRRRVLRGSSGLSRLAGEVVWATIVFAGGIVAARYIERIPVALVGWLVFAVLSFLVSLARAVLYRRAAQRRLTVDREQKRVRFIVHQLVYPLFATAVYLALSLVAGQTVQLVLLLPLWLGALLPDLDSQSSLLGRLLPFASRRLEDRFGHRREWHSLGANAFVAVASLPLAMLFDVEVWVLLLLGFLSHLGLDLVSPRGCMLFWPINRRVFALVGRRLDSRRQPAERVLAPVLALVVAILFLTVDVGPPPPPAPAAPPTFAASMERYQAIRGRNMAVANVAGTWQTTGRPVTGRYEILSAAGQTLVLHERFGGRVFSAGRGVSDNLYLRQFTVAPGDPIRVKPVEIRLEAAQLGDALPVLYEMQAEPGLQHIFISGEVIGAEPALQPDLSQTAWRHVQVVEPDHYLLSYLSAAELIALAEVQVDAADLVVVATYLATPKEAEPTLTPLPSPDPQPADSG